MNNAFLVGKEMYLRPVELADAQTIQNWHNDPDIRSMARLGELPVTFVHEEKDIEEAIAREEDIYLLIVTKSTDKPVGFIRVNYIDRTSRNMWLRMIIGDKEATGKHLAEDSLRCVLHWLFSEQNVHRVSLETYGTNKRAIGFFKKLGFKQEGVIREAVYVAGEYHDIIAFGLLSREFQQV